MCVICSRPGILAVSHVARFSLHGPEGERLDGPLCEHCYAELRTGASPTGWAAIHARLARGA